MLREYGGKPLVEWLVWLLGAVIFLVGLVFVAGGAELALLGGSLYYLLCGPVLLASGLCMLMGRLQGALLYLAALAYTWVWSVWEVGFSPIDLLPRAFGPTLLGLPVLFSIPVLRRMAARRAIGGTC
ncbi:glycerol dehydrogenase [Komagataeibacter sp. AV436]|uniref:Glycerol dehydrogenase n=1 Tax=Komagataeibacter melomenusus TaxID=2766578 RepID=A0ABX2AIB8_9PROT|nr:glycerol dehydrogenase [Komagataeibacter melomenusus]MBV1829810.1 glycerol dehydrogenase [Komagataeibacter melomenusus]NPC67386.1 glycerol dehydrogenase [Komagataeibacter melomenusus]